MPENAKKAFFVSKVRNCPAFQREYLDWKRKSDDDPTKTFETSEAPWKTLLKTPEEKRLGKKNSEA